MRLLLVADIHSNPAALTAIREKFEVALFLGDLVEYGVEPGPCIEWVKQNCRYAVRGNHDHGAAHGVVAKPAHKLGFKYLTSATRPLGRKLMNAGERRFLAELPLSQYLTIDGVRFLLVHGTPRDPLDEFALPDPELWARRLEGIKADIICIGHTHRPYALEIGNKLVINPGSVGLQREGDPRAAYGIIEGRSVELKRIEYPIEETVASVENTSLPEDVKYLLTEVYRYGQLPKPSNGMNGYHNSVPELAAASSSD